MASRCELRVAVVAAVVAAWTWGAWPRGAAAQPLDREKVPPDLRPWIEWVLDDRLDHLCPVAEGKAVCLWPGSLRIEVGATGGSFEQRVVSHREIDAPLPGSTAHWPAEVQVDGRPAVVLQSGGRPYLRLAAGEHRVQGRFTWPALPEVVQIPQSTALVRLRVEGRAVPFPRRDEEGKLWLKRSERGQSQGEQISLSVHRRIDDGVPVMVTTRLRLRAGGRAREVELGRVVLQGTVPMALKTELPARLERDGNLFVQVQAGTYTVEILARSEASPDQLVAPKRPAPWPRNEIWVWSADESVRQATISGPTNIDPKRTDLDAQWHSLPAYLLKPGEAMRIATVRRGQPDPPPNHLQIERQLWLDLDGRGYTARDTLTGTLHKGYRLDLLQGDLGHVASGETDQLITRSPASGKPGVELREANLRVVAEWRNEKALDELPAVGWSEDVQKLEATLHLPPGWSLLSASGVDEVQTWISRWDLFGFFFVLLMSLALARLVGRGWGALGLFTLAICYHEPEAPLGVWFSLLAAVALLRIVPEGRLRTVVRILFGASAVALLLIAVPFAVEQIRIGLYPQIEERYDVGWYGRHILPPPSASLNLEVAEEKPQPGEPEPVDQPEAGGPMPAQQQALPAQVAEKRKVRRLRATAGRGSGASSRDWAAKTDKQAYDGYLRNLAALQQDPKAVVQTGPGVPSWYWKAVEMSWSGPVARDHRIELRLLSPAVNRLLSFLRVILLGLLAVGLVRAARRSAPPPAGSAASGPAAAVAAGAALFAAMLAAPAPVRADVPDKDLRGELQRKLTLPAACYPECVSVDSLSLSVDRDILRLTAEVHAGAAGSFRLPGPADAWVPETVQIDGRESAALRLQEDGFVHARVLAGVHRVSMAGPLPPADSLTLTLGDAPHRVAVDAEGWKVDGVREDGRAEQSIQISRLLDVDAEKRLQSETLPAWLEITRVFVIGTSWEWQVLTSVRRVSPPGSPVVARYPLLPGESVTEKDTLVKKGEVVISLGRDDTELSWSSKLERREQLRLVASREGRVGEVWVLQCGPVWQCRTKGLAPVQHQSGGRWEPVYHPWPGEKLRIAFARPESVAGQSTTIDSAELEVSPGIRILKAGLSLSLRSSVGGVHSISLPEKADIQQLLIDGEASPIRRKGRKLSFTLQPGASNLQVQWQQPGGIGTVQGVPAVDLGRPAVNARVTIELPSNRLLLWAGGPAWGPAILFWGYLLMIVMVALVLPRAPHNPLRRGQWILLGLGLTQVPAPVALFLVAWFFVLAYREQKQLDKRWAFNLFQLTLVGWTVGALGLFFVAVHEGLLVQPDMQVAGAMSSDTSLSWYVDRVAGEMPRAYVLSVSIWFWRIAMLLWSLWLAASLIKWLPWCWRCFSAGGVWRAKPLRGGTPAIPQSPPPEVPPTNG